jgi:hypothetical protein
MVNIKRLALYLATRINSYLFLGPINIVDSQSFSEIDNNLTNKEWRIIKDTLILRSTKRNIRLKS